MLAITVSLALQVATVATGANAYATAYQQSISQDKPLLVLVGAQWCGACLQMKRSTLAKMSRQGQLNGVAVAHIDLDRDQAIARKIVRGAAIPQLILFYRTDQGWQREYRIGAQSEVEVLQLLRAADSPAVTEAPHDAEAHSQNRVQ